MCQREPLGSMTKAASDSNILRRLFNISFLLFQCVGFLLLLLLFPLKWVKPVVCCQQRH